MLQFTQNNEVVNMIRNNLSILLAERQLKITKVSKDTEIARSTITSIAQNDTKMIQLDVINRLCTYLSIEPKDFFSFVPIDIDLNFKQIEFKTHRHRQDSDNLEIPDIEEFSYDLDLLVTDNTQGLAVYKYKINLNSSLIKRDTEIFDEISIPKIYLNFNFKKIDNQKSAVSNQQHFIDNVWKKMDASFRVLFIKDLKQELISLIANEIETIYLNEYPDIDKKKVISKNLKKRFLSSKIKITNVFFDL